MTGTPVTGEQLLNTRVTISDGTTGGSDGGQVACRPGAPLVTQNSDFPEQPGLQGLPKVYPPGTYTITFTAEACDISAADSITFTVV